MDLCANPNDSENPQPVAQKLFSYNTMIFENSEKENRHIHQISPVVRELTHLTHSYKTS